MTLTRIIIALAALMLVNIASAQTLTTLFNSGVDNSNAVLAAGAADGHFLNGAAMTFTYVNGAYASNATSAWDANDASGGSGSYTVSYRQTFTVLTNTKLSSINIAGQYAVDNSLNDILINGHSTSITLAGSASTNYSTFHLFTLPTSFYLIGTNTIDWSWTNTGGPGAINVFYTSKSYALVPEMGGIVPVIGSSIIGCALWFRKCRHSK